MVNGIMHYDVPDVQLDAAALDFAKWAVAREIYPFVQGSRVRSIEEISVDMTTAPGWRWAVHHKCKSKAEAWATMPEEFDYVWEQMALSRGEREFEHVWSYMLKQELLKKEKIEANMIRALEYPDVTVLFTGMRMCQDFDERLMAASRNTRFSIGFSKWHGNVDLLARQAETSGEVSSYGMYDFVLYDSSLRRQLYDAWYDIRREMMSPLDRCPENINRLSNLCEEVTNSRIALPNGDVLEKKHGTCSGSWSTCTDNTGIHALIDAYTWGVLVSSEKVVSNYSEYQKYWCKILGDDSMEALVEDISEKFSLHKRIPVYESMGLSIHRDPKKTRQQPVLEGLEFLGFTFKKYGNMYVPYYNPLKALCSLYRPGKKLRSLDEEFERAWGLTMECFWTEIYPYCDSYCRMLIAKGAKGSGYEPPHRLAALYTYQE